MNETKTLASYLSGLSYEDLPEEAVTQIKKTLLDWMALTIRGSRERAPYLIRSVLLPPDGGRESTVFGLHPPFHCTLRTSSLNAAFVNGAASHSLDFDDLHNPSIIHLACVTIPAAMALAEARKASGRELLTAIAAGYELGGRVGESIQPDSYYFWHTTGTVGTLAAAASAASILHLDSAHYLQALGSAGTQAAGLWEFLAEGAMSKPLHAGKACYGGVLSALLAEKGYTGATKILEGEKGFCRAMMKKPHLEKLTENLGKDFIIIHNSIKPYPCCKHSHAALYGIHEIMDKNGIRGDDVKEIILKVNDITDSLINNPTPRTPYGCKFSLQYCAAVMAVNGAIGIDDFREQAVKRENILEMMKKVTVQKDPGLTAIHEAHPDQLASAIEIRTKDGKDLKQMIKYPKGDPENPMTFEELAEKGHHLTDEIIGPHTYDRLFDLVMHMDQVKDVDSAIGSIE